MERLARQVTLYTTRQLAAKFGCTLRAVQARAMARGIKPTMTVGGAFLWSDEQARLLRPGPTGRPKGRKRTKP